MNEIRVQPGKFERRYDIDWLRILTLFMVFVFHCSRFFDENPWHIKNGELSTGITIIAYFFGGIGMPLFFIISGMATFYFLGMTDAKTYTKARFVRIMVPFLLGIFTHIPLQVYLDRVFTNDFVGNFFQFYPQYFNALYSFGGPGNFPWRGHHLWFLILLFAFSILTVLPFVYLRKEKNMEKLSKMASFFQKPGMLYLLVIPVLVIELFSVTIGFSPFISNFGGYNLFSHLIFYIIGFILASDKKFKESLEKNGKLSLIVGIVSMVLIGVVAIVFDGFNSVLFWVIAIIYIWSWIMVILGLASKRFNVDHKSRRFLNEISMPFYILHQSVIIIIGFYIIPLELSILIKFLIIFSVSSVILLILVLIIRQVNLLRFLFGMGPKRRKPKQEESTAS